MKWQTDDFVIYFSLYDWNNIKRKTGWILDCGMHYIIIHIIQCGLLLSLVSIWYNINLSHWSQDSNRPEILISLLAGRYRLRLCPFFFLFYVCEQFIFRTAWWISTKFSHKVEGWPGSNPIENGFMLDWCSLYFSSSINQM